MERSEYLEYQDLRINELRLKDKIKELETKVDDFEKQLIIHTVSKRLEYLQKELLKAKKKTKETEVERNYFKYIGAELHIEEMIKQAEKELNAC